MRRPLRTQAGHSLTGPPFEPGQEIFFSSLLGTPLEAIVVSEPVNGDLTLNPDGSFEYVPDPGYNGADYFTSAAVDAIFGSQESVVDLTVDPIADIDGSVTIQSEIPLDDLGVLLETTSLALGVAGDGSFSAQVDPGAYTLNASAEGYENRWYGALTVDTDDVQIPGTVLHGGFSDSDDFVTDADINLILDGLFEVKSLTG